jgi:hypothetical protein
VADESSPQLPLYSSKINSNIILPSIHRSSEWSLPFTFSDEHFVCIHFPLSTSFKWIRPSPRPRVTFRNKLFFFLRWGVVSPSPNPQFGGPNPVGCPRLLIQYIRSCSPYFEAVSSNCNLKTSHAVVTGPHITWGIIEIQAYILTKHWVSITYHTKCHCLLKKTYLNNENQLPTDWTTGVRFPAGSMMGFLGAGIAQ